MSQFKEVFADNLSSVHFTGNLARIDFTSLVSGMDGSLQEEPNVRLIMDVQQVIRLRDCLDTFVDRLQGKQKTLENRYNPGIFNVHNIDEAKSIILTKEGQDGSEERWRKETPALISILRSVWNLHEGVTVVDYGCGIGRIAKELCKFGCKVIGVDISSQMRELAIQYVADTHFSVVSPQEFVSMIDSGFICDYACAIWVLQHCLKPEQDLTNIKTALKRGGELFVVNNKFSRAVPVVDKVWQDDKIDIWKMLADNLWQVQLLDFPEDVGVDARCFQCGFYKRY